MARNRNSNNNKKGSNSKGVRPSGGKTPSRTTNSGGNIPETLKRDIGNFNWYRPVGTKVGSRGWYSSVPTLAAIKVQPTLGISNDPSSPTSQMARVMYNYIVRINATSCPYEPVDLQLGMLAMSELYKFVTWASRIYKYANTYSIYNRAIPNLLFAADYVDMNDILDNLTDYRAWLNTFIAKCGTLSFPGNLQFLNNIDQLFSGVYLDEDTERAQILVFTPHAFYKYDELSGDSGMLVPIIPGCHLRSGVSYADLASIPQHSNEWGSKNSPFVRDGVMTFNTIQDIGNQMLEAILRSDDMNRISADVYKAYSPDKLLHFTMVDESESLSFYHSDMINSMIENANIIGRPEVDTQSVPMGSGDLIYAPCVTQDPSINKGHLVFNIAGASRLLEFNEANLRYHITGDCIFNVHNDVEVDPNYMVDLARFTPCLELTEYGSSSNAGTVMVKSCGTEIITEFTILSLLSDGNISVSEIKSPFITFNGEDMHDLDSLDKLTKINAFRCLPRVTVVIGHDGSKNTMVRELISFDKYAVVPQSDLKQIHDAYLLAQFQIPEYSYTAR